MNHRLDTLREQQTAFAEKIVTLQYERQSEIWRPYGNPGHAKSVRDAGYHLVYLIQACEAASPALFNEYLAWVKVLFANLHFADSVLPESLECTRQVLTKELPEAERAVVLPVLEAGMTQLSRIPTSLPGYLEGERPVDLLARDFMAALLKADRMKASRLILDAVRQGMPVRDVYMQVFQRTQREIGRLWQTNQISVAQEHFCTAATQMVMSQLYPYIFTGERKDRRLVMACVGGELHEIGARMVADFFEMEGWDTYFLGANTPVDSILQTVADRNADILALSATMTFHVEIVKEIIDSLRQKGAGKTRVLVGGYPFNLSEGLWQRVGADGFAPDAEGALLAARQIMA